MVAPLPPVEVHEPRLLEQEVLGLRPDQSEVLVVDQLDVLAFWEGGGGRGGARGQTKRQPRGNLYHEHLSSESVEVGAILPQRAINSPSHTLLFRYLTPRRLASTPSTEQMKPNADNDGGSRPSQSLTPPPPPGEEH